MGKRNPPRIYMGYSSAFTQPDSDRLTAIRGEMRSPKEMKASTVISNDRQKGTGWATLSGKRKMRDASP
jgi:hypothetical protein